MMTSSKKNEADILLYLPNCLTKNFFALSESGIFCLRCAPRCSLSFFGAHTLFKAQRNWSWLQNLLNQEHQTLLEQKCCKEHFSATRMKSNGISINLPLPLSAAIVTFYGTLPTTTTLPGRKKERTWKWNFFFSLCKKICGASLVICPRFDKVLLLSRSWKDPEVDQKMGPRIFPIFLFSRARTDF